MFWKNQSITEFIDKVRSVDFEDYGTFEVTKLEGDARNCSIGCSIKIDDDPGFHEKWVLSCVGVRKSEPSLGHIDNVDVKDTHVLLAEYREPKVRLGFRGTVPDPYSVVGALYKAHQDLADDWIPLSAFLMNREIVDLVRGGFGILAEGPAPFIGTYERVLGMFGFATSTTGQTVPKEWNESGYEEYPNLRVLLMGQSFVVAEQFIVKKV